MATQIQLRRDTAADWTSNNPTLAAGEVGWESDTGLLKIGDGSTAWTSLDYSTEIPVNTVATTGATETLDTAIPVHDCTMDQNCTFTFTASAASGNIGRFTLILRGAFTPTWPASVDWPDATEPTYSTPTLYEFVTVDGGTTWLGVSPGKAFA